MAKVLMKMGEGDGKATKKRDQCLNNMAYIVRVTDWPHCSKRDN